MLPMIPTAEITRSTVSSWILPADAMVAVTLFSCLFRLLTVEFVSSVIPWAANCFVAKALISASSTGSTRSRTSTTVTAVPMLR